MGILPMHSMTFENALRRILRPLARLAIARRFGFPAFAELLKGVYVDVAESRFRLNDRRLTDSRVSLLTGLQRRDVRALRAGDGAVTGEAAPAGPLPRVVARWSGGLRWQDRRGRPLPLPRRGPRSFESLVAEVSRDIHPRTVLDQLLAEGAVAWDAEAETVTLLAGAYLPRDEAARLAYLGANLGDHAEAAAENLLAEPPPFVERAAHYNQLSPASLAALDSLARTLLGEALARINAEALKRQDADRATGEASGRFRAGAFIYSQDGGPAPRPAQSEDDLT